jgi:hypothetical protein
VGVGLLGGGGTIAPGPVGIVGADGAGAGAGVAGNAAGGAVGVVHWPGSSGWPGSTGRPGSIGVAELLSLTNRIVVAVRESEFSGSDLGQQCQSADGNNPGKDRQYQQRRGNHSADASGLVPVWLWPARCGGFPQHVIAKLPCKRAGQLTHS